MPSQKSTPATDNPPFQTLIALYNQGEYPELERQARALTLRSPGHGFVWKVLSLALHAQGRLDEAVEAMRQARKRLPEDGEIPANLGVMLLEQNALTEAEACFRHAVSLQPELATAWHNLGITLQKQQRFHAAEQALRQALRSQPGYARASLNLGMLLESRNRLQEAEAAFRHALDLQPGLAEASHRLGILLAGQNRGQEAETAYRHALTCDPKHADAHNNLGILLAERKAHAAAANCFRQALEINPELADAHYNLGNTLRVQGRLDEAASCYRRALACKPDLAAAHCNLGLLNYQRGHLEAAELCYRQGLSSHPNDWENLYNLGITLHEQGRHVEAETSFRMTLRQRPDHPEAHNNLGNALYEQFRLEEAEACYRQALACQPDYAAAHNNLGNTLNDLRRTDEAAESFRRALVHDPGLGNALALLCHCLQTQCQWQTLPADTEAVRAALSDGVVMPIFPLLSLPFDDGHLLREASERYVAAQVGPLLTTPPLVDPRHHPRRERLRIGYLSADFRNHPITQLYAGLLETHDRASHIVHGYAIGPDTNDAGRQRIVKACDVFRDLAPLSDLEGARRIADDQIDILVDFTGYMQFFRPGILARRPAPLIVNFTYPGTMGHPRMADYKISDPIVTPPSLAGHFTETLALLPHCFHIHGRNRFHDPRLTRDAAGLPEHGFVFCSFNQYYKFSGESFALWCRLLHEVEESVLWLPRADAAAMNRLRQEAAGHGIEPDRVLFAPRTGTLAQHMARLSLADLALDTFPYTSQTTGGDALSSGVPLITRMGNSFVSRVAASLLHAAGLPELVTGSWQDYYRLALELAHDPVRLRAIRERLRANLPTHPLFDTEGFARDMERLYERMWRDHGANRKERIILSARKQESP
ncbi:MAG: tetratricopeptide repeat protein [Magnetococcales bacterium]|nr:tetratricopeptide repeat protein [Magnetococcales bacterium]